MTGTPFLKQLEVRTHVYDYLEANGMTSLRKIAAYVGKQTGDTPSASTISRLVRDYGFGRKSVAWEGELKGEKP